MQEQFYILLISSLVVIFFQHYVFIFLQQTMLSVNNLSTPYLSNISFNVPEGESLGIVGANGSGKTTLAKTLMGLNSLEKGEIKFYQKDISPLPPHERSKQGLCYIFQHIPSYPHLTIQQYFDLFVQNKKIDISMFRSFGLDRKHYKTRKMDQKLSGGERKKIEIILNFHLKKKLYIMDEIEGHLDQSSIQYLLALLEKKQREGISFLFISHHPNIQALCQRSLLLCNGGLRMVDETSKVTSYARNNCKSCEHIKENQTK